ncbi:MAG: hypothetical protein AAFV71_26905 [Cyanobacteria bacterium J06633_8]
MSKFISAIAGLMTFGAIVGYFNAKDESNQKFNLHLGLITTGLTIGAIGGELSKSVELERKVKDTEDKFTKEIKALTKEKDDYLFQNKQFSSLFIDKDTNVKDLNERLQKKEQEVSSLKQGYQVLEIATKQKIAELDVKIARDDDRQDKFIEDVKQWFAESLKVKIDYEYERIADTTVHRLNDKRFEDIHTVLERFYQKLKIQHNDHYEQLQDIYSLEGDGVIQEVIDTYFRISMEISSLHVRLRNLLNTTTKLTLEVFRDELIERRDPSKFVSRDKVQQGLDYFQTETKVKVDKVRQSAIQNDSQLQELREEVDNFLNDIEQKNLEIDDLKQQLKEAKKPLLFYGVSIAARAGNSISNYYYKYYDFKLDCITWAETETGYTLLFGIRQNPGLSESDLFADNSKEKLAGLTNSYPGRFPKLEFNRQDNTVKLVVTLRPEVKKVISPEEFTQSVRDELQPPSALIDFVKDAYHVGLWAETGSGKTTAISNIIGGMISVLGGSPEIRLTIPKIDESTQKIFPRVDWLGVPKSVFGLLEAALEIQYRIYVNEQAYLAGEEIKAFTPILFFIDEINMIFTRWGRVNEADIIEALDKFSETLSGERLEYFNTYMRTELLNYKNEFAKRLLLFIWQTGRSLNVKSLVAGQNLQPGAFRMMKTDLTNCAYLALADSIESCIPYKVKNIYKDGITAQKERLDQAVITDPLLKFTGLCCPNQGKPYFGLMPEPNYYKWGDVQSRPINNNQLSQEINFVHTRKQAQQEVDLIPHNMDETLDNLDKQRTQRPKVSSLEASNIKACPVYDDLPNNLKTLEYGGMAELYAKLPKKPDGSIHKTDSYEKVFKVKRSEDRKIMSQLIDFLESEFRL